MSDMINVSICDGKYTIIQDASGRTKLLRHGEPWRWVTGDNVILGAAYEIEKLQERIKQLEDARTVAAANSLANMLAYEDAIAKIKRLEDCAETAWGIIANVDSGSWQEQRADWREAATRWRDERFHPELSECKSKEAKP